MMHNIIFVLVVSITNVQTGQVMPDALVAQCDSIIDCAQLFNQYRGTEIAQGSDGDDYVLSSGTIVGVNAEGNIVYPGQIDDAGIESINTNVG